MFRPIWKLALFVCLCFLYLHGLGSVGLLGPDEPRYASIGREMARSGDWVTPRLWGDPWFEKPAFLYWLVGIAYKAGLNDDWAPRIGVALLSLAFLVFYHRQLRIEFGAAPALYATTILSTSAGWFAYSQVGVTDLPMSALYAAAVLVALRWMRVGGWRKAATIGALLGFAVLAKGLVPVILAAPLVWFGRRWWREWFVIAGACFIVAAPWYLLCYSRNGWPFIQEFFIEHQLGRFATDALKHVQPFWFYIPVFVGSLFPWSPLLAIARPRADRADPRRMLLLGAFLWGFAFFSAATNKLPGYMLPLLPLAAALIGVRLSEVRRGRSWIAACVVLLALAPLVAQILPPALDEGLSRASLSLVPWWPFPVAAAVAAISWWVYTSRGRRQAFAVAAVAAGAAILYLQAAVYPALDARVSARGLYAGTRPGCVRADVRRQTQYGLNFYAGRRLPDCP